MSSLKKQKHDKIVLNFNEKVIADTVISKLNLTSGSCCLELFGLCSLSGNGLFDKYGCYSTALSINKTSVSQYRAASKNERVMFEEGDVKTLDVGQFDTAVIFNLTEDEITRCLSSVFQHLDNGGKAVILNTAEILSDDSLRQIACGHKTIGEAVSNKDFSLLIIF